jgi:hypothetical protein
VGRGTEIGFTVTAILPTSPRWQNFQLPRRGALVQAPQIYEYMEQTGSISIHAEASLRLFD